MPENYFVAIRRMEKQKLLKFIKEHSDMALKKLLAIYSNNTGLKVSTLQTYMDELRDAELIE